MNVGPFDKRSLFKTFGVRIDRPEIHLAGDVFVESGFAQSFHEPYHRLAFGKLRLPDGRIKFDAFQANLDDIPFRDRAFPKSCEVELDELLECLAILNGDIDSVSSQERVEIETLHFGYAAAHRVGELGFRGGYRQIRHALPQLSFSAKFNRFGI